MLKSIAKSIDKAWQSQELNSLREPQFPQVYRQHGAAPPLPATYSLPMLVYPAVQAQQFHLHPPIGNKHASPDTHQVELVVFTILPMLPVGPALNNSTFHPMVVCSSVSPNTLA